VNSSGKRRTDYCTLAIVICTHPHFSNNAPGTHCMPWEQQRTRQQSARHLSKQHLAQRQATKFDPSQIHPQDHYINYRNNHLHDNVFIRRVMKNTMKSSGNSNEHPAE
jgi:hypothetical protein